MKYQTYQLLLAVIGGTKSMNISSYPLQGSRLLVGEACNRTSSNDDTCKTAANETCADWVDIKTHDSTGLKCQSKDLCGKEYKDTKTNTTYDIACTGIIGDSCKTVGVNDTCN